MISEETRNRNRIDLFVVTLAVSTGMWDIDDATAWLMAGWSGEARTDASTILERIMMFKPVQTTTTD